MMGFLLYASLVLAQVDEARARDIAWNSFTEGGRVELKISRQEFDAQAQFREEEDPQLKETRVHLKRIEGVGSLTFRPSDGMILSFDRPGSFDFVSKKLKELSDRQIQVNDVEYKEIVKNEEEAFLGKDKARVRAEEWASAIYPEFSKRRFEVVQCQLWVSGPQISYSIRFRERPTDEWVAVYENEVFMSLNPVTGTIVMYRAEDLRLRFKKPAVYTEKDARQRAQDSIWQKNSKLKEGDYQAEGPRLKVLARSRTEGDLVWEIHYMIRDAKKADPLQPLELTFRLDAYSGEAKVGAR